MEEKEYNYTVVLTKDQQDLINETANIWYGHDYEIYQTGFYLAKIDNNGKYGLLYFDELPDEVKDSIRRM